MRRDQELNIRLEGDLPDDDLSDAARRLGDRFLPDPAAPEGASTDLPGAGLFESRDIIDTQTSAEIYDRLLADIFRDTDLGSEWHFVARLETRARRAEEANAPSPDWGRIVPQLVVRLRDGEPGVSEPRIRLAGTTDINIRLVVQDTPYIAPPPADATFSWEAMAEHTDLDFRLIVREDDGATDDESDRQYRIDAAGSSSDGGWWPLKDIGDGGATGAAPVTGRVGWNLETKDDVGAAESASGFDDALSSDDFSFAPDNFLQTPSLDPGALGFHGHYDLADKAKLYTELTFDSNRGSEMLSPDIPFSIEEDDPTALLASQLGDVFREPTPEPKEPHDAWIAAGRPGGPEAADANMDDFVARIDASLRRTSADVESGDDDELSDPAWDALVIDLVAHIQDNSFDHAAAWQLFAEHTDVRFDLQVLDDDGSGAGRVEADAEPVRVPGSVLDTIDIDHVISTRTPPPTIPPADLRIRPGFGRGYGYQPKEPPTTPPPPDHSVLDYLEPDEKPRGPSSPFEAIGRELEAERRSLYRRVPTWIWPTAAAVIIALGALVLTGGGEDEPLEVASGGGDAPAATATATPEATTPSGNVEETVAPTEAPAIAPTMTAGEFPTLRICPDGSSFSGSQQPDGSFLDAETGEVRVCPPPPN